MLVLNVINDKCNYFCRYMIAEVHYGGKVTDDYDKRLLITLTAHWFNKHLLDEEF